MPFGGQSICERWMTNCLWWANNSTIFIAKNPIQDGRTKHLNVKFHAMRETEKYGDV